MCIILLSIETIVLTNINRIKRTKLTHYPKNKIVLDPAIVKEENYLLMFFLFYNFHKRF